MHGYGLPNLLQQAWCVVPDDRSSMDSPRELKVSICKIPDWTTGDQHPILNLMKYSNVQKTDVHTAWIMRVHGGDAQLRV